MIPHQDTKIRTKILIGYLLIALVSIFAVVYIYKTILPVALDINGSKNPMYEKSMLIGDALSTLYEVEYDGNRLIQSATEKSIKQYAKQMLHLKRQLDSLEQKELSDVQHLLLNDIQNLLLRKEKNMNELIYLSQRFRDGRSFQKIIDEVVANEKAAYSSDVIIQTHITQNTILQNPPKENFWKRFGRSFRSQKGDTIQKIDSLTTLHTDTLKMFVNPKDSLERVFYTVMEKMSVQKEINNKILKAKLNTILLTNREISGQIRLLLNELNREALYNSFSELKEKRTSLQELTRIIIIVAIVAILIVCVFLFLIFTDLHKSQTYKRKLEVARKYAEDLMQSRHHMLLNIAHDIKAPLCSITGYLELMENSEDIKTRKYSTSMHISTNYIMNLLENLLEYARMETGKSLVQNTTFNLKSLFENLLDSFMPLAEEKHLDLHLDMGNIEKDVFVEGDEIRIRQIMMNLLSNGVKFTESGEIRLVCSLDIPEVEEEGEEGRHFGKKVRLDIRISDTGCGIVQEKIPHIFDEFLRVESEDRKWREGNGLGLAVVKGTLNLLGGNIDVSSELGKGTCFQLSLPLRLAEKNETFVQVLENENEPNRNSIHLLLVDDDALQLAMLKEMLVLSGYTVFCAQNMQEIDAILASEKINLILTDLQMDDFTGYTLLENLQKSADAEVRSIPVVAVSASERCVYKDLKQRGFVEFLKKPFVLRDLIRIVKMYAKFEEDSPKKKLVLDLSSLEEMMEGDSAAIENIVSLFKISVQENIEQMELYLAEKKYKEIKQICHKMLPMFLQLGVKDIGLLLTNIDRYREDELTEYEVKNEIEAILKMVRERFI